MHRGVPGAIAPLDYTGWTRSAIGLWHWDSNEPLLKVLAGRVTSASNRRRLLRLNSEPPRIGDDHLVLPSYTLQI